MSDRLETALLRAVTALNRGRDAPLIVFPETLALQLAPFLAEALGDSAAYDEGYREGYGDGYIEAARRIKRHLREGVERPQPTTPTIPNIDYSLVVCPGCGWTGEIAALVRGGACPTCGYENGLHPNRLLTLTEMLESDVEYTDVRMDLFLRSVFQLITDQQNTRYSLNGGRR